MQRNDFFDCYCPVCDGQTTITAYLTKKRSDPKRERQCKACKAVFTTLEDDNGDEVVLDVLVEPTVEDLRRALVREMMTDVKLVGNVMEGTRRLAERVRQQKRQGCQPVISHNGIHKPIRRNGVEHLRVQERGNNDIDYARLSKDVRRERKRQGLTQKNLARQLGIAHSTLCRFEGGQYHWLYDFTLAAYVGFLGKDVEDYRIRKELL